MPLLTSRSSPSVLQRLSDRRRALALVGLAAAAVLGAKAARRKAAAGPPDYVTPAPDAPVSMPVAPAPSAVAATAGPAVEDPVVPVAVAPDAGPEPEAAGDAGPEPEAAVAPEQPAAPATEPEADSAPEPEAPAEPNTEELAAAEIAVLAILSQEGRLETDRTALGIATTLEREATDVAALLRSLHRQGHVAGDEYTATGDKIWFVTDSGGARIA